jgi:hypothetical protein
MARKSECWLGLDVSKRRNLLVEVGLEVIDLAVVGGVDETPAHVSGVVYQI